MKRTLALVVPALLVVPWSARAQAAAKSSVAVVKAFAPGRDEPLTRTGVTVDQGGWRIQPSAPGPVRLFEIAGATCESAAFSTGRR